MFTYNEIIKFSERIMKEKKDTQQNLIIKQCYRKCFNIKCIFIGGKGVWGLAIYSFLADITTSETRSFRFAMIGFASQLAAPLAPIVGAYLLSSGGYVCVFSTSLALTMLGALYMVLRIRPFNWKPEKKEVLYFCNYKSHGLLWYFSSLGVTNETFPLVRSISSFQFEII